MDKKYVLSAFGYLMLGLVLGIYMASSKNHGQLVTHAHIMLLGFVVSFIYGVCFKIWLKEPSRLISIQFYLHQFGSVALLLSLFLMFGGFVSESVLGPILGISSIVVLSAAVLMKVLLIRAFKKS